MSSPSVTQALLDKLAPMTYKPQVVGRGYFLGADGGNYYLYPVTGDSGLEWAAYCPTQDAEVIGLVQHYLDAITARVLQQGTLSEGGGNVIYNATQYAITDAMQSGAHVAKAVAQ